MTRLIIITAARFLASKNQIQLVIVESGDLGHQTESFSPTQFMKCRSTKGQQQGHVPNVYEVSCHV